MNKAARLRLDDGVQLGKLAGMQVLERFSPARFGSLSSVRTKAPYVALTFDDGPTPQRTPGILEQLGRFDAKATFFVLATNVRRYPTLLQEIMAQGHEIAVHGLDHRPIDTISAAEFRVALTLAKSQIEESSGVPMRLYRPPYGRQSLATWRVVGDLGMTSVLWSRTAWDWKQTEQDVRIRTATRFPHPGVIVLMHDGHAGASDRSLPFPEPLLDRAELTRLVLQTYADHGLSSTTVGGLLALGTPAMRVQFRRSHVAPVAPQLRVVS